jgi:hypothetical protein
LRKKRTRNYSTCNTKYDNGDFRVAAKERLEKKSVWRRRQTVPATSPGSQASAFEASDAKAAMDFLVTTERQALLTA